MFTSSAFRPTSSPAEGFAGRFATPSSFPHGRVFLKFRHQLMLNQRRCAPPDLLTRAIPFSIPTRVRSRGASTTSPQVTARRDRRFDARWPSPPAHPAPLHPIGQGRPLLSPLQAHRRRCPSSTLSLSWFLSPTPHHWSFNRPALATPLALQWGGCEADNAAAHSSGTGVFVGAPDDRTPWTRHLYALSFPWEFGAFCLTYRVEGY